MAPGKPPSSLLRRRTGRSALLLAAALTLSTLFPGSASAQGLPDPQRFWLDACWSGIACKNLDFVTTQLRNAVFYASPFVMLALFVVGAAFVVFSAGQDTPLQKGKSMMLASLIGLAIIVSSYAVWRTVICLLYGSC